MSGLPDDHREFARAALAAYGLDPRASLRLLSVSENATYLADDGDRHIVLRIHRPGYHRVDDIRSELSWMSAIAADTPVSTPLPVLTIDSQDVLTVVVRQREILVDAITVIPGCTAEDFDGVVGYAQIGQITAQLHEHSRHWRPPPGFTRFRWDLDSILGPTARWGDWRDAPQLSAADRDSIERAVAEIRTRITEFGYSSGRFGLIHADLRLANLMINPRSADSTITVIDFDDCGWSWYLTDLASALSWMEDAPDIDMRIAEWLDGYTSICPLEPVELAMIPSFVMLRRIHLTAWIASHPAADAARAVGPGFVPATAALARRYLNDRHWLSFRSVNQFH
ncbi:MAG: phosphotransferase [Gordonia sp. (in: high G+C Gram-positive bacteria)]